MKAFNVAAALGLAVACLGGSAHADRTSVIKLNNKESRPVTIEFRIGMSKLCDQNKAYVQTIPPKDTFIVKIRDESTICMRVQGTAHWTVRPLAKGQDYSFDVT
ncbi:MAG TPA: hypothetical protein VGM56_00055 [Byssovorax sp.]|jgi:hypothetical protein